MGKPKDCAIYKTENGGETLADFIYESGAELNASAPYFVAYYPQKYYNNYFNQDDKSLEVTLPNTQNYTAGNIEQDAYPMVAVSKGTKLSFKNVLGIVRLNLKSTLGGVKVRKIIISSNKPLWGISSITFGDGATAPILNAYENEYLDTKNMTLDCGEAGVALNADAPTEFMVTLPPAEYKTFRIQVIDTDNRIQSFAANRTISVARSAITTVNLGVNALKSVSTLRHGYIFNYALMRLANNTENPETFDKKIKTIRFVTNSAETSEMIVSDETTAVPAYAVWNAETGEMVIHTAADKIMAHTNSSGTFKEMRALTSLDLTGLDTENATDMNNMFRNSFGLPELDVSKLNTANVTDMSGMFSNCEQLTELDVSMFNTEKVGHIWSMFDGCSKLTSLDLSMFNTEKVEFMNRLFRNCNNLTSLNLGTSFTMDLVSNTDEMCCDMASVSGACTVSCTEETENKIKASNKFPTSGISFVRPQ